LASSYQLCVIIGHAGDPRGPRGSRVAGRDSSLPRNRVRPNSQIDEPRESLEKEQRTRADSSC
jgi:hypothetical protein